MITQNASQSLKDQNRRLHRMEVFLESRALQQTHNSWGFIGAIYVIYAIQVCLLIFLVYPKQWLSFLPMWTKGVLNQNWLVCVVSIGVYIYGLVILRGHQSWKQIGLDPQQIKQGAIVLGILWMILNVFFLLWNFIRHGAIVWAYNSYEAGIPLLLGNFIAQITGVGIIEEVMFRGYLWPQVYKKFNAKYPTRKKLTVTISMFLINIIFALFHIPVRITQGYLGWHLILNLALIVGIGVSVSFIYLLTENLWIAIGFHALNNFSLWIWTPSGSTDTARFFLWVFMAIIVILWPKISQILKKGSK